MLVVVSACWAYLCSRSGLVVACALALLRWHHVSGPSMRRGPVATSVRQSISTLLSLCDGGLTLLSLSLWLLVLVELSLFGVASKREWRELAQISAGR